MPPVYGSAATKSTTLTFGKLWTPREPGTSSARGITIDVPSVHAVKSTGTCTYIDNSCEGATCEDDTSESDIDQTNMEQASHTFLYMLLSISGMKYSALVDTGSSINIMSRQVYDTLPSSHKSEIYHLLQSDVSEANNTTVKVDGTATVKVNIEGHVHSLLFYIFPTCTHPIILGTHYLISHNVHIDFEKMTLQGSRARHIKIRSTRRIDLPPQSETIVWGKAPTHILSGTQGICSNDSYLLKKGVMVAKSLCTVPVDRFVPIKLLNSTHYSVCIPKGKCLSS